MTHHSPPRFRTLHALGIKGFATTEAISEMTMLDRRDVEAELQVLDATGWARFREQRALWQVTADGRAAHEDLLAADLAGIALEPFRAAYGGFIRLNGEFKALCGTWQLRGGLPNDHTDHAYDRRAIEDLRRLHERVHPITVALEAVLVRYAPYEVRLEAALLRLEAGERELFTGVMCGSYHDIWMELHEDLLLTQRIDRSEEGSF